MKKILLLIPTLLGAAILASCTGDQSAASNTPEIQTAPEVKGATPDKEQAQEIAASTVELMQAALDGNAERIDQALAAGFGADTRDEQERTLLMYAAFNGHSSIVKLLLHAGADVDARDWTGTTALMFAASGPDTETVEALIGAGAAINAVDDNEHFTALMWAAAEGQLENAKLLLRHGADPMLKDIDGDTAGSFAAQRGHAALAELLQHADRN